MQYKCNAKKMKTTKKYDYYEHLKATLWTNLRDFTSVWLKDEPNLWEYTLSIWNVGIVQVQLYSTVYQLTVTFSVCLLKDMYRFPICFKQYRVANCCCQPMEGSWGGVLQIQCEFLLQLEFPFKPYLGPDPSTSDWNMKLKDVTFL